MPKSTPAIVIGAVFLVTAAATPLLMAAGAFEASSSPRAAFFKFDNAALLAGLAFLALSGVVSLLRGLGYPIAGPSRNR